MTGSGDRMGGKNSGQSHGVKPASKAENGLPNMVSAGKGARYADNMAQNQRMLKQKGGKEEGGRKGRNET